ncbi:hypothetical protein F53441_13072 [Fusarium austroafricanum]|uniref:Hydrophobin n=1 Tax=Fusarium austroafricanum TaxID=2364996 RepID=A0A8H4JR19_9HYPO|nr:hypothetical protein F53441_13072 [Fusarium austroafricanum]
MQFYTVASLFLASTAFAVPAKSPGYDPCPSGGFFGNPECCDANLVGVFSINCRSPTKTPKNAKDFQKICAKSGQKARCCGLAEAGDQGLICQKPVGVSA